MYCSSTGMSASQVVSGDGLNVSAGSADTRVDLVDDRLLVDRVPDRLPHAEVVERRVRLLQAVAAVDRDLVDVALLPLDGDDALGLREPLERRRRDVERRVDLALLERGDHRVRVVEDAEDDLVVLRPPAPVALVRDVAPELAGLVLGEDERPRADAVEAVVPS